LPTGDESMLRKSIVEKLYTLDDDIIVHPGHGDDTSIGYEKKFNLYVNLR
jgi:hydroxyacylglutathione hydrolase